jgi:hypothetical protein
MTIYRNSEREVPTSMADSADHIKMAAFRELQEAIRFKRVNDELLEYLTGSLRWILHYVKRHNIPLPEQDKINEVLERTFSIADKLPRSDAC